MCLNSYVAPPSPGSTMCVECALVGSAEKVQDRSIGQDLLPRNNDRR